MHKNKIVEEQCGLAKEAFYQNQNQSKLKRYFFLISIKKNIINLKDDLIETAYKETYLPKDILSKEIDRTCLQIDLYSDFLLNHHNLSSLSDDNDLELEMLPLGVVVIFGASNFPFAYSTAGGDVISALVSGCSVIYKAHPSHINTSRLVAKLIEDAIQLNDIPKNTYSHLELSNQDACELIRNDNISCISFTGSHQTGRYLFDICQSRKTPIPFFGELGSLNPVFILPCAFQTQYKHIADEYIKALTQRSGQICIKPAIIVIPKADSKKFTDAIKSKLEKIPPSCLLNSSIQEKYVNQTQILLKQFGSISHFQNNNVSETINPLIIKVSSSQFLNKNILHHEIFGPFGTIVEYEKEEELESIANTFSGELTASIWHEENGNIFNKLKNILSHKVGRLIFNGFSTPVKVSTKMTHGGPYPASTDSRFTAVGQSAISRFLRPLTLQNQSKDIVNYINKHEIRITDNIEKHNNKIANHIATLLNNTILNKGYANIALSGGKSPKEFLEILSNKKIRWANITISLVDERIVELHDNERNEKLIRDFLIKNEASSASFVSLIHDSNKKIDNIINDLNKSSDYPDKYDVIVLGMGDDGHFASLFPNSNNLEHGLTSKNKFSYQNSTNEPKNRISMNLDYILKAKEIILCINGKNKVNILRQAFDNQDSKLPIRQLLQRKKITIFMCE